ncbi:MAG TPA: glycosyltransferase family 2 protein [Ferruginibacter sp.]|nr:glycosyltransferase family 2 protein [Ferruginibacter sp.]HMP19499.1 glycosyltransferase family 2 protein [Ferruginibacter sp.]
MKLSVVIPAYNEALNLPDTIQAFYSALQQHNIEHELLVVNDNSKDNTEEVIEQLQQSVPTLRTVFNPPPANGFGMAVRKGLDNFTGDCVAIVMADLSDSPEDLVKFYNTFVEQKVDCVFGNRFTKGAVVEGYPKTKLIINRIVNHTIAILFKIRYRDFTNAFKLYSKQTIEGLHPFLSPHFNLTVELSLKAVVRGHSYAIVPNSWRNRKHGTSNLKIKEMGSRYFFIILYCFIEKYFSRGDFKKKW